MGLGMGMGVELGWGWGLGLGMGIGMGLGNFQLDPVDKTLVSSARSARSIDSCQAGTPKQPPAAGTTKRGRQTSRFLMRDDGGVTGVTIKHDETVNK